jgi:hypothetical protein
VFNIYPLLCSTASPVQIEITAVRGFEGMVLAKDFLPLDIIKLKAEP